MRASWSRQGRGGCRRRYCHRRSRACGHNLGVLAQTLQLEPGEAVDHFLARCPRLPVRVVSSSSSGTRGSSTKTRDCISIRFLGGKTSARREVLYLSFYYGNYHDNASKCPPGRCDRAGVKRQAGAFTLRPGRPSHSCFDRGRLFRILLVFAETSAPGCSLLAGRLLSNSNSTVSLTWEVVCQVVTGAEASYIPPRLERQKKTGLFTGHDPIDPRIGSGGCQNLAGRVRRYCSSKSQGS